MPICIVTLRPRHAHLRFSKLRCLGLVCLASGTKFWFLQSRICPRIYGIITRMLPTVQLTTAFEHCASRTLRGHQYPEDLEKSRKNLLRLAQERLASNDLNLQLAGSCLLGDSKKALATLGALAAKPEDYRKSVFRSILFTLVPLHSAILNGMTSTVDLLLKLGASKYTQDAYNKDAAHHASQARNPDISRLLVQARS